MKVKINGNNLPNVKRGFVINDRLDEELDSGTIISLNTQEAAYAPFSVVEVYITNDDTPDHYFYVDSDQVIQITKQSPFYYQHTIQVIELTKILERYYIDAVGFTQPTEASGLTRYSLYDVITRIVKITPLETSARHTATRVINLDTALLTALQNVKAPEIFFNNQHLLQAFIEVFKYTDGFPRISSFSATTGLPVLQKTDLNKILAIINPSIYNKSLSVDNEYFANNAEINIENGVSTVVETYPANKNYAPLTSDNFIITTNDLTFILPKNIYDIKSLKMLAKYINLSDGDNEAKFKYTEIDLTDLLYEEDLFNALKTEQAGEPSKYGSLVFKKGDNKISGFGIPFPQLWGFMTSAAIKKIFDDNDSFGGELGIDYFIAQEESDIGSTVLKGLVGFKVEYYPYLSIRTTVAKQASESNNNYTITINQGGQSINVNRLLSNAQATLNRIGNQEFVLEKVVKDYNDRFKGGQITTDNHIVTTVENEIFEGAFRSKAILSKNFNRLSSFVGIDRDVRQYEIPLKETIKRNLKYQEFVLIGDTLSSSGASGWTSGSRDWLKRVFTNSNISDTISSFLVTTKDHNSQTIGTFLMSASKAFYKNGNIFHFNFVNSQVAYFYPIREDNETWSLISQKAFKRYVYWDEDNLNDVKNGTFAFLTMRLIGNDVFDVVSLCKPAATAEAAIYDYIDIQSSYPLGLFYVLPLGTTFTDGYGEVSRFLLAKQKQDGINPAGYAVTANDIMLDLLSNRLSFNVSNDDGSTSHPDYLGIPYLFAYNQTEIPIELFKSGFASAVLTDLVVDKDPIEAISMTYQLQFISKRPYIIIGSTFTERSPYMINRTLLASNDRQMHLYRSTDYYREGEIKTKGVKTATAFSGFSTDAFGVTDGFPLVITESLSGYNSWAIGDNNGNLYVAVNRRTDDQIATTIYIQFKNTL